MPATLASCYLTFYGENFSDLEAAKLFSVTFKHKRIEQSENYAILSDFYYESSNDQEEVYEKLLLFLEKNHSKLREIGAEQIILYLTFCFYKQCNLEFPEYRRFNNLLDNFCVTCYVATNKKKFEQVGKIIK